MGSLLVLAAVYLGAAVICVPLAVRFGFGSVLGYLIAGVLIGPVSGLVGSETTALQHVAEFGVVMMLFLIGLELEPRALWQMRKRLMGLGFGQVTLTAAAIAGVCILFGFDGTVAIAIGLTLSLSSTAIVLQTLGEKGLTPTPGGRSSFSVLLAQDIAVIPILAILPLLGRDHGGGPAAAAHGEAEQMGDGAVEEMALIVSDWVSNLPGWGTTLMTVAAVAIVVLGGHFLTRPVFAFVAKTRLREMLTITSLLFVIGVAALMTLVGLSPALGTFLAGVVLANSEFRHELEADIEPFKGLLLGLFFITVGAGMDFEVLTGAPLLIAGVTLGLLALKAAILLGLGMVAGLRGRDLALFTLSLPQAGEFGFVLSATAVTVGAFTAEIESILLLAIALSMLLTPLLFIGYEALARRMQVASIEEPPDEVDEEGDVIIAGVGRFGQVVHRMLRGAGVRAVVLDRDVETIRTMRRFGVKTYLGDPTRPDVLKAAGLERAKVLVIALDDRAAAVRMTKMALEMNPGIEVIARAYDRVHVYELYRAGARQIVREMFDSSLRAGRYALERLGWTETEAYEAREAFYAHDRDSVRQLAALWKPGIPVGENEAYARRAAELSQELENGLIGRFGEDEEAARAVEGDDPVDEGREPEETPGGASEDPEPVDSPDEGGSDRETRLVRPAS
ncbi:monovalent cation:proton antiporter-2 (CPA2) family protein [Jannaschia aquimarina]|uniref:KefC protein n=1 Tax=Jannaschia aquimarina TaxID=935700 RepID=A0A0D1EFT5_9RHOB|nr:monovalent cation:proton antiporter-2 (CPA2) family protein [Jannaschia aquimarina]KIT16554.1 Glutathione-regulated potassium-efflux system protein KefC [Jannaschia aquimarina]SNT05814.1 Kef-type potassium/proton antiporter, CPA2 family [Jannaschia aquimarina]